MWCFISLLRVTWTWMHTVRTKEQAGKGIHNLYFIFLSSSHNKHKDQGHMRPLWFWTLSVADINQEGLKRGTKSDKVQHGPKAERAAELNLHLKITTTLFSSYYKYNSNYKVVFCTHQWWKFNCCLSCISIQCLWLYWNMSWNAFSKQIRL